MRILLPLADRLRRIWQRSSGRVRECCRDEWSKDPLSHPALRNMTLEQLADLPFERGNPPASRRTSP
jgi:hypothetical protein